jgi:hypothetical protein
MPLRMSDYAVQIYRYQIRKRKRARRDSANERLSLVLPIVFYTGTRQWDSPGLLSDLIEQGEQHAELVPSLKPLYINLPELSPETLRKDGGYLGPVLHLIQQRRARPQEFARLLAKVVESLERMPAEERLRWLDLLSYLHAMIYHERTPAEFEKLAETIERSVATDDHRQEIHVMGQTIAEKLIKEGKKEGKKEGLELGELQTLRRTLQMQLRKRFGRQAEPALPIIEKTSDTSRLALWLERFANAKTIQDLGIR